MTGPGKYFDTIIIGAGHAGLEAAWASANMGCSVGIVTMDLNAIGRMSCNPAIGGSAKGHLVKEVDALGGIMGKIADETGIQFRMLNKSKGPAIWSPRSQNDRDLYSKVAKKYILTCDNIDLIQDTVDELILDESNVNVITSHIAKGEQVYSAVNKSGRSSAAKRIVGIITT